MRSVVLLVFVLFVGALTTAVTMLAPAEQPAHHAVRDEVRARSHVGHGSHMMSFDQDDDVDDDGSDDDVNAPSERVFAVASVAPVEAIVPVESFEDTLGPSAGHAQLLERPPRASAAS